MTQSEAPQLVGSEQLAPLLQAAAASTRKRSHLLLHADQQDQVQRLLIALEPESFVRPHVHGEQWEMIVLLRGRFDFLIFDPQAELVQRLAMSIASPVVQIPRGTWHSGVALAPETLVLEIKPGPYRPNEFAPWAPEEGEPTSGAFVHWAEARGWEANGVPRSHDLARGASPRLHCRHVSSFAKEGARSVSLSAHAEPPFGSCGASRFPIPLIPGRYEHTIDVEWAAG